MDKNEHALPPPGGNENLGAVILGVNWVVFTASTIIVFLRLSTRLWITHNFGWDDVTMVLTQMINAVGMGFVMVETAYGLGRHRYYLSATEYQKFLKYDYLDWLQVFVILALSKISICLFLMRLSNFNKLRRFLYALIAFLVLSHLPLTILYMVQCRPLNKAWNPAIAGQCFPREAVEKIIITQGVFSIITDFIGAAFPVVLLWNVKISIRTKVALCLLMGLGVMFVLVYRGNMYRVGTPNALVRIFEVNLGIIAACTPILKPFLRYMRARISGKDPHQLLRTPSGNTLHSRWYTRLLGGTRSTANVRLFPTDAKTERSQRLNPFHGRTKMTHVDDTMTAASLGLPLQGIRKTTDIEMKGPDSNPYESQRSLDTDAKWDVQDRV